MKKRIYSLQNRVGIASLCFIALGLTACHPKTDHSANEKQAIETEDISWEEKASAEGCKISATYPTDGSNAVIRNIQEWMNEELGGTYDGNLSDGQNMIEYYGKERAKQIKSDIAEFGENTAMSQSTYYAQFKRVLETEKFISYTSNIYEYMGGAHGGESLTGMVFRKSDGRRFGWDMFTSESKEQLRSMIKNDLKRKYFTVKTDEEFYSMLLDKSAYYSFPLPITPPIFRPNGVQFIYQQYEIAPYASGMPTCTIPYDSLQSLFTVTMKPLIESTTDSLARTFSLIPQ